ncbi:MAG: hypothetical protein SCABRO_01749 [Candidatus Scalindua brodae]|uniref:Uncharacterized protein n=1 Tax=Candidatus Scalindua brodae TaxID=237368 RepID=A0A0B0EPE5_9BACT|nr:MAG: hypothetical protein SCABRO_01749 [Candidatus Scalindua brodae]
MMSESGIVFPCDHSSLARLPDSIQISLVTSIYSTVSKISVMISCSFFVLMPWSSTAMINPIPATRLLEIRSLNRFDITDFVRKYSIQTQVSTIAFERN